MTEKTSSTEELRKTLSSLLDRGAPLERQGFPLGSLGLRTRFEEEARTGSAASAEEVVAQAQERLELGESRWPELKRLLEELDRTREVAGTAGMDLARLDTKSGNPREELLLRGLSSASLDACAVSARLALATLREALPRFCVDQARALGAWARRARDGGENVSDAIEAVGRVASALQDGDLEAAANAVADARSAMARSASPASRPSTPAADQEEILREAHFLARRLPGTEGGSDLWGPPRGGASLAGVEVLASPEEEIAALWAEVDRLARERDVAAARTLYDSGGSASKDASVSEPTVRPSEAGAFEEPASPGLEAEEVSSPTGWETPEPREKEGEVESLSTPPGPEEALAPPVPAPVESQRTVAPPVEIQRPAAAPQEAPEPPASTASGAPHAVPEPPARGPASPPPPPAARISFSAAYVPPAHVPTVVHRAGRAERARPRRSRSRHKT